MNLILKYASFGGIFNSKTNLSILFNKTTKSKFSLIHSLITFSVCKVILSKTSIIIFYTINHSKSTLNFIKKIGMFRSINKIK